MKQIFLLLCVLFIVSCVSPENILLVEELPKVEEVPEVKKVPEKKVEEPIVEPTQKECTLNTDCEKGFYCIEKECAKVDSLNGKEDGCSMCTLQSVTVLTSDGETYTEGQGKGSYATMVVRRIVNE